MPAAMASSVERRQPHDVEPHVVDAVADPRIGVVGHDLRGDHVTIMDAVAATSPRAPSTVSSLFTFQPPCSYGASMGSPYAPRG